MRIYALLTQTHSMRMGERRLILESPEMHASDPVQSYIAREVSRPCKQWIHDVLSSRREAERVILRTPDFVLLPDVETFHKRKAQPAQPTDALVLWSEKRHPFMERKWRPKRPQSPPSFHWLAVATDTGLRTLRDLRGHHIPMLAQLYRQACQRIKIDTGVDPEQVMAFIHYPPSVYQLHVHFKYPVSHSVPHDTFRIHPLASVINNLHIDSGYYSKSLLQLPVYLNTELYSALRLEGGLCLESVAGPEAVAESGTVTESVAGPGAVAGPGSDQSTVTAPPLAAVTAQTAAIQTGPPNGYRLRLLDASLSECSPTTSPGSRPCTPDLPAGTGSGSATPATSP